MTSPEPYRFVVFLTEEYLLPTIATLDDMMRHPRQYHACDPSHAHTIPRTGSSVKHLFDIMSPELLMSPELHGTVSQT
jgi:hypothetical protein